MVKGEIFSILYAFLYALAFLMIIMAVIIIIRRLISNDPKIAGMSFIQTLIQMLKCLFAVFIICVLIITMHRFEKLINGVEDTTTQEENMSAEADRYMLPQTGKARYHTDSGELPNGTSL